MRNVVVAALVLLLGASCADPSVTSPAAAGSKEPPADLASAKEAWQEAGITNYTMDVKVTGCMACGDSIEYSVTVVDGQVTQQTSPPFLKHPEALTVDKLFEWISGWGPDALKATYNEVGVPIEAHVDAENVFDEQADYAVTFQAT